MCFVYWQTIGVTDSSRHQPTSEMPRRKPGEHPLTSTDLCQPTINDEEDDEDVDYTDGPPQLSRYVSTCTTTQAMVDE